MMCYYIGIDPFLNQKVLLARYLDGVCASLIGDSDQVLMAQLKALAPYATLSGSDFYLKSILDKGIQNYIGGVTYCGGNQWPDLGFGTDFQQRVWTKILYIPKGETYTYSELAYRVGNPKAVRAVASACAKNPLAIIVPCHRVVPKSGGIGNYRWGQKLKEKLLQQEKI